MKKILLFDNGSTLTADIEKVLSRNNIVYQKVKHDFNCDNLDEYKGIIFSGSPDAVYDGGRLIDIKFIKNNIPKFFFYILRNFIVVIQFCKQGCACCI